VAVCSREHLFGRSCQKPIYSRNTAARTRTSDSPRQRSKHSAHLRATSQSSADVAGRLRQQASERRDPGHPRGPGPPVRHRRGGQVHRRGFPGPCGGCRVTPPRDPASSEPGFGRASTRGFRLRRVLRMRPRPRRPERTSVR
jgi:hypothetical protein